MNNLKCPECGAARIRNFVWDHSRTACQLGNAEDATKAADFERLADRWQIRRDATPTEIVLAEHVAGGALVPDAGETSVKTIVTKRVTGIHHRVVGRVDPDTIEPTTEEN